jgi:hypothetical protein
MNEDVQPRCLTGKWNEEDSYLFEGHLDRLWLM